MKLQYKTAISDRRWIAYDIPGNIGWITWLVCAVRGLREKRDIHSLGALVPAMLAGSALCAFFAGLLLAGYKKQ